MKKLLVTIYLIIYVSPAFSAEEKFMCITEHFLDASAVFGINEKDIDFEIRQLNRLFLLTVTEKNIILTDTNIENKNSQKIFTIIKRVTNTNDIMAVTVNPLVVEGLVFNPVEKIGTKTYQGSFLTYVSYLKCS